MKQLQFYKYAALVLLLLNLSMIAFFFLTKPKPPHQGDGFQKRGPNIMNMDEKQHDLFLQSAKQHGQHMKAINKQQQDLLKPYFYSLIDSTKNTNPNATLNEVQDLERQKIESTYQHFQEVKSILKPEQQADFELFMNDVIERILMETKKNPPPPKEF